jgi:hypothetical protein
MKNSSLLAVLISTFFIQSTSGQQIDIDLIGRVYSDRKVHVGSILESSVLASTSSWIQIKNQGRPVKKLLYRNEYTFEVIEPKTIELVRPKRWLTVYCESRYLGIRELYLSSLHSRDIDIRGVNDLPQVLNRPLTGLLSNLTQETKIAQLRHQLSTAIAQSTVTSKRIEVCTGLTVIDNPIIEAIGFSSIDEAKKRVELELKRVGLKLKVADKAGEGKYLIKTVGSVITEIRWHELLESPPQTAFTTSFFLGDLKSEEFNSGLANWKVETKNTSHRKDL